MNLRDILQSIIDDGNSILLNDCRKDWEASDLLNTLSAPILGIRAHYQPGLYIAEINPAGYLGSVLYRIKSKETKGD